MGRSSRRVVRTHSAMPLKTDDGELGSVYEILGKEASPGFSSERSGHACRREAAKARRERPDKTMERVKMFRHEFELMSQLDVGKYLPVSGRVLHLGLLRAHLGSVRGRLAGRGAGNS